MDLTSSYSPSFFSCNCCNRRFKTERRQKDTKTSYIGIKAAFILFLLCSSGFLTGPVVSALVVREATTIPATNIATTKLPAKVQVSQELLPAPDPDCLEGTGTNCTCIPLSKCKKCTRFEMFITNPQIKQIRACLYTTYQQKVFCNNKGQEKYISCKPMDGSKEEKIFWIFEIGAVITGTIALSIVYYRNRLIQKQVTKRIQRQLNA